MAVLDKSIRERCNACSVCLAICPQDVFRIDKTNQKATIEYLGDCVACGMCERFCPRDCLEVTFERLRKAPLPY